MGHLIDQPVSPLQRVIQFAQRTIAIAVVGCAALALWAGPATAADNGPLNPASPDVQAPAPPAAVTDAPTAADQVSGTVETAAPDPAEVTAAIPVQSPDLPQVAASVPATPEVHTAVPDPAPVIGDVSSKASASIDTAVPASDSVTATKATSTQSVKQTLTGVSDSADLDGVAGSVADLGGSSPAGDQSASGSSGREMLRDSMTPPRSTAGPGISVTVKHVMSGIGKGKGISPSSLLEISGPTNSVSSSSPSSAPASADGGPGLPGLPGPLQIPVLGSSGSTSTSSSGFFFFGFAGLLVGLWAAFAPALSRRLQGSPASWRPAPYLSLLELPG